MGIRTPFDPLGTTGNQRGLPFTFTIDTRKNTDNTSDTTFIVPFAPGTYSSLVGENIGIMWGDGTITIIGDGVFTQENCTHLYAEPGEYTISIKSNTDTAPKFNFHDNYSDINNNPSKLINTQSGIIPQIDTNGDEILNLAFYWTFHNCTNLRSITADLFKNCPNITENAFRLTFENCTSLTSIPANLFRYNTSVTNGAFHYTFCNCTALTAIPNNLFRYNTEVGDDGFCGTFHNCTSITTLPETIFLYNTKVGIDGFEAVFSGCTNLTTIPTNLFYTNILCTSFKQAFKGCSKLTINPYIFGNYSTNPSIKTTRFNNDKIYNFTEMFYRDTFTGVAGTAGTPGDFWTWTYQNTPTSAGCYGGQGNITITDYNDIPQAWGGPTRYTVTIHTVPNTASILFQTLGGQYTQIDDHTIEVLYGTQVRYTVSKDHYETYSKTITVTDNYEDTVTLDPILYTFTVNPIPSLETTTVTLTCGAYEQVDNSISVPWDSDITWTVSDPHYNYEHGIKQHLQTNDTLDVPLTPKTYTININVISPENTTTIINNLQRTTAQFVYNTAVTWSVSKEHYVTQGATFNIDDNYNLDITLAQIYHSVTITVSSPTTGATVIINGIERTTASFPEGTIVTYSVTAPGYASAEDTFELTTNKDIEIDLEPIVRLTIIPDPDTATVILTADHGEQPPGENYIEVPKNEPITWSVSKEKYVTQEGIDSISVNTTWTKTLRRVTYKFEIIPTPQNAIVTMTCSDPDYVQEPGTNYIMAPEDTYVDWTVTRDGCDPAEGRQPIGNQPITLPVTLIGHTYVDVEDYNYTETSSGVTITKYVGSGTIIEAPHLEQES